ncbi:mitochondrial peptide chain release factor C12orf65-like protein [Andalucia godoyi]|uniref:Mitochondrial peptide chain release factor C12orf65-like protein n=1 Tax=Andalucia godoyi TaxID=505711 RepID=A0A8K0F400_ANDGO|nr:mitochondrial peptide chain release factor C12orf65-like protein [Andalucia godoyi]|eukprot:ANDGO_04581.mRNA.1 mitochondrial peptide chain release factor C12orf65 homolog
MFSRMCAVARIASWPGQARCYAVPMSQGVLVCGGGGRGAAVRQFSTDAPFVGGKFFTEEEIEEQFTKGSGNGGQKVNKSVNAVILKHIATGTMVKCHAERSLYVNRKIARKLLDGHLDAILNGKDSKVELQKAKVRKQRDRRRRRQAAKKQDDEDSDHEIDTIPQAL